ncbi:hypothetical protein PGTUg99_003538 [Puccinia graminis f. sp. tritici]|uniref:Uncharacterized protein n=1 Tax=Puccinia graminis f. sp. tritici TaxID=56615 RepID=A0A5B0M990_PUCGR|nr:hypothetical protein PGTUg99_003538 [Puccinia graminis f. sp. tritici]
MPGSDLGKAIPEPGGPDRNPTLELLLHFTTISVLNPESVKWALSNSVNSDLAGPTRSDEAHVCRAKSAVPQPSLIHASISPPTFGSLDLMTFEAVGACLSWSNIDIDKSGLKVDAGFTFMIVCSAF